MVSLVLLSEFAIVFQFVPSVKANPSVEDFTTFTEVDPNNHIALVGTNHIDWQDYRNESCYLYKDKGAGHFGNFTHLLDYKRVSGQAYAVGYPWALTNDIGDFAGLNALSKTAIGVEVYNNGLNLQRVYLAELYGGTQYESAYYQLAGNTTRYLKIVKSGTSLTCYIYSDADRTSLLATINLTLHGDWNFRYIFASETWNSGHTYHGDCDIENLDLQEAQPALVVNQLRLSTITSETNITSITVNTWYDWEANITDSNTLNDIVNVTIRIKQNPTNTIIEDTPAYNESTNYWFRYVNSTNSWAWYSGSTWTTCDWLNTSACAYPTKTGTNGWYLFRIRLSKVARYNSQWEFSGLAYDSNQNSASKVFSDISIAMYDEMIMITSEHHWTNILVGATNVLVDEGTILFNVTCNYQFDIQARSNDTYARNGSYTIGIGNVTIHKDTLGNAVSLTTSYADVGGLTNQNTYTSNVQYSLKLWCTVPEGTEPFLIYRYTLQIQITS